MDKYQHHYHHKNTKKRCLSDFRSQQHMEIFEELRTQQIPKSLQKYIEEQGELGAIVNALPKNPQSYIKVFTFQYLTLCFNHKEEEEAANYLQLIYDLIQKEQFEFILPQSPHQLYEQSHMNLKNIISQYLNYMRDNSESVLVSLGKYPLIMDIFVAFFKTMLYLGDVCDLRQQKERQIVKKQEIFQFLTSYFEVEAFAIKQIICFRQSKVSIFQVTDRPTLIYIIYHQDPIYKIDDSKFSQMLNKKQQISQSGVSSVKCLISNIQIKSYEELEKKQEKQEQQRCQQLLNQTEIAIQCESINQLQYQEEPQLNSIHQYQTSDISSYPKVSIKTIRSEQEIRIQNRVITEESSQVGSENETGTAHKLIQYVSNLMAADQQQILSSWHQDSRFIKSSQSKNNKLFQESKEKFMLEKENNPARQYENLQSKQETKRIQSFGQSHLKMKKFKYDDTPLYYPQQLKRRPLLVINKNQGMFNGFQQNRLNELTSKFYRGVNQINNLKQIAKLKQQANLNVSSEFTSSFILNKVSEPSRTAVKMCKERARENRKNARAFLI